MAQARSVLLTRVARNGALVSMVSSLLLAAACSKESPPTAEQPRAPVGAAPAVSPPVEKAAEASPPNAPVVQGAAPAEAAAASAAKSELSEGPFELKIKSAGPFEVGKPATAELLLVAKAPFHVNEQYPYKFKLKEAPGLTFPTPVVGKDAAKLEKMTVTMAVPFSAKSAGKHTLAGQFAFSVCTDDKCLIEKRDLSLDLEAK